MPQTMTVILSFWSGHRLFLHPVCGLLVSCHVLRDIVRMSIFEATTKIKPTRSRNCTKTAGTSTGRGGLNVQVAESAQGHFGLARHMVVDASKEGKKINRYVGPKKARVNADRCWCVARTTRQFLSKKGLVGERYGIAHAIVSQYLASGQVQSARHPARMPSIESDELGIG
jgi:hypothetical protein